MKPTSHTTHSGKKSPLTDYHYHSVALGGFTGSCAKTATFSLRNISRDYFDGEANRDFLTDLAVFGTLLAVALVPIISGASAVIDLARALAF
jgi:hypothetical protein